MNLLEVVQGPTTLLGPLGFCVLLVRTERARLEGLAAYGNARSSVHCITGRVRGACAYAGICPRRVQILSATSWLVGTGCSLSAFGGELLANARRAPGIEGVFAVIEFRLGIRRFSVRGLSKIRIEWNWICTAYNLKKLLALNATAASGGPKATIAIASGPKAGIHTPPQRQRLASGADACPKISRSARWIPAKRRHARTMRACATSSLQTTWHRNLHVIRAPRRWPYVENAATA